FFQAEDGIRDLIVTGVQTCALPIFIGASTGDSWRLSRRFPNKLLLRDFEPGFTAALSAKDTGLALDLADEYGVPMAIGSMVGQRSEERRVGKEWRPRWVRCA